MPLPNLTINKNWFTGSNVREINWDNIRTPLLNWSSAINKAFQQLTLDGFGASYDIGNDGSPKLSSPLLTRVQALENGTSPVAVFSNGWTSNLSFIPISTNLSQLSIIAADGNPITSSNPAFAVINSSSNEGQSQEFRLTNTGPTIDVAGAHWGFDGNGDVDDIVLRVFAINVSDTSIVFGIGLQGGRDSIVSTNTFITATSVILPEHVLVSEALPAGTWPMMEIGYGLADFTDSTNEFEFQFDVEAINPGRSADGVWSPWNPAYNGFSTAPSGGHAVYCMIGKTVLINHRRTSNGTSNATNFTISLPIKPARSQNIPIGPVVNNGSAQSAPGTANPTAGSVTMGFSLNLTTTNWTSSAAKNAYAQFAYES